VQTSQNPRPRHSQENGEQGSGAGQRHAFGQHLAKQTAPPGSQRGADGDFFLSCDGPRQQQVGQIGTDDQHHHADRAGQHQQCRPDLPLT
jgi:hypothetical protein